MTWPFSPLRPLSYQVVDIDPPWPFELRSAAGAAKSASAQYNTMPVAEIMALPVGHLAQNGGIILLWLASGRLREGLACLDAWHARLIRPLTWRKVTRNGKVRWGTGYRVRDASETILLGVFGDKDVEQFHKPFPSIFDGIAREHSRKPDEFYAIVERCTPRAWRCSLFSRETRAGWDSWGDQAGKFDACCPLSTTSTEATL